MVEELVELVELDELVVVGFPGLVVVVDDEDDEVVLDDDVVGPRTRRLVDAASREPAPLSQRATTR